jgi:hypothetical protein
MIGHGVVVETDFVNRLNGPFPSPYLGRKALAAVQACLCHGCTAWHDWRQKRFLTWPRHRKKERERDGVKSKNRFDIRIEKVPIMIQDS